MKVRQKIEHTEREDSAQRASSAPLPSFPAPPPTLRGVSDATVREMHFDDVSTSSLAYEPHGEPAVADPSSWWPSADAVVGT